MLVQRARSAVRSGIRLTSQLVKGAESAVAFQEGATEGKNDGYLTPAEANAELLQKTGENGGFAHVYQSFDPVSFIESVVQSPDPHGALTLRESHIISTMEDLFGKQDLSFNEGDTFGSDSPYFLMDYTDDSTFDNKKYLLDAVKKGKKLVPFFVMDTKNQMTQVLGVQGEALLWTLRRHNVAVCGKCDGQWVRDDFDDEGDEAQCGRCAVMMSQKAYDSCIEPLTSGEDDAMAEAVPLEMVLSMEPHRLACAITVVPEFQGERFVVAQVMSQTDRTRQIAPMPSKVESLVGVGEAVSLADKTQIEASDPDHFKSHFY